MLQRVDMIVAVAERKHLRLRLDLRNLLHAVGIGVLAAAAAAVVAVADTKVLLRAAAVVGHRMRCRRVPAGIHLVVRYSASVAAGAVRSTVRKGLGCADTQGQRRRREEQGTSALRLEGACRMVRVRFGEGRRFAAGSVGGLVVVHGAGRISGGLAVADSLCLWGSRILTEVEDVRIVGEAVVTLMLRGDSRSRGGP